MTGRGNLGNSSRGRGGSRGRGASKGGSRGGRGGAKNGSSSGGRPNGIHLTAIVKVKVRVGES